MSTERNDRSFFFCASCGQIFFFSGTNTWSWARLKFHLFHFKQQGCAKMMNLPFVGIWCTRALPSIPQFVLFEESFLLEWETTVCTYCSIEFFVVVGSVFYCYYQSNLVQSFCSLHSWTSLSSISFTTASYMRQKGGIHFLFEFGVEELCLLFHPLSLSNASLVGRPRANWALHFSEELFLLWMASGCAYCIVPLLSVTFCTVRMFCSLHWSYTWQVKWSNTSNKTCMPHANTIN